MKKLTALLLALVMVLGMAAASADMLADIQAKGTLVVGANVLFPPYEFYTVDENGNEYAAGFDMSLARGLAEALGVELDLRDLEFSGLITSLRNGEIDCIISGLSMKPERQEVVDFSTPYFHGQQILLVRVEDVDKYKTVADTAGKKIGAQVGSLQAGILEDQLVDAEHMLMEKVPLMVLDLINGELDGLVVVNTVANQYMKAYPGMMAITEVPLTHNGQGSGVAVQKGDNETLLAFINDYLAQIKADGTFDGWVEEAYAQAAALLEKE